MDAARAFAAHPDLRPEEQARTWRPLIRLQAIDLVLEQLRALPDPELVEILHGIVPFPNPLLVELALACPPQHLGDLHAVLSRLPVDLLEPAWEALAPIASEYGLALPDPRLNRGGGLALVDGCGDLALAEPAD